MEKESPLLISFLFYALNIVSSDVRQAFSLGELASSSLSFATELGLFGVKGGSPVKFVGPWEGVKWWPNSVLFVGLYNVVLLCYSDNTILKERFIYNLNTASNTFTRLLLIVLIIHMYHFETNIDSLNTASNTSLCLT